MRYIVFKDNKIYLENKTFGNFVKGKQCVFLTKNIYRKNIYSINLYFIFYSIFMCLA